MGFGGVGWDGCVCSERVTGEWRRWSKQSCSLLYVVIPSSNAGPDSFQQPHLPQIPRRQAGVPKSEQAL